MRIATAQLFHVKQAGFDALRRIRYGEAPSGLKR
jgi:hypothetical protein